MWAWDVWGVLKVIIFVFVFVCRLFVCLFWISRKCDKNGLVFIFGFIFYSGLELCPSRYPARQRCYSYRQLSFKLKLKLGRTAFLLISKA